MRVVVDACVLEIYAADGTVAVTKQVFPDAPVTELVVRSRTPAPDDAVTPGVVDR